jgi:hypothetical protein
MVMSVSSHKHVVTLLHPIKERQACVASPSVQVYMVKNTIKAKNRIDMPLKAA